jgi:hypothetical protein
VLGSISHKKETSKARGRLAPHPRLPPGGLGTHHRCARRLSPAGPSTWSTGARPRTSWAASGPRLEGFSPRDPQASPLHPSSGGNQLSATTDFHSPIAEPRDFKVRITASASVRTPMLPEGFPLRVYDTHGQCIDMPCETEEFRRRVDVWHPAYSTTDLPTARPSARNSA